MVRLSVQFLESRWSRSCPTLHPSRPIVRALHSWSRNTFRGAATTYITTERAIGFLRPSGHREHSSDFRPARPARVDGGGLIGTGGPYVLFRKNVSIMEGPTWGPAPRVRRGEDDGKRGRDKRDSAGSGLPGALGPYSPFQLRRNPPNVPFLRGTAQRKVTGRSREPRCDAERLSHWSGSFCYSSAASPSSSC